jgi:hypothetical protein
MAVIKPLSKDCDKIASRTFGRKTASLHVGLVDDSEQYLFGFPFSDVWVDDAWFVSSDADGLDASDYWECQLIDKGIDGTETVNLLSTVVGNETGGTAIAAHDLYSVTPDQNQGLEMGSVLAFTFVKNGSATDLNDVTLIVQYREAH